MNMRCALVVGGVLLPFATETPPLCARFVLVRCTDVLATDIFFLCTFEHDCVVVSLQIHSTWVSTLRPWVRGDCSVLRTRVWLSDVP